MKKTGILLIAASMLLTSCGINVPGENSNDSSEQNTSSETESKTSESSSKPGKYDDYKNCEWFNIGLEKYTDANGNNTYFNGLVVYETLAKGVYTKGEEYKVFVCDNGDAVFVETRGEYKTNAIDTFDKSEYNHTEINLNDKSYEGPDFRKTKAEAIYYFYFDLAIQFYATYFDSYTYENTKYNSVSDVISFLGFNIRDKSVGTIETSDTTSIICRGASGYAGYDESYLFSTYMNYNPSFKCAGLPPFLSENNIIGWAYKRAYSTKQDYKYWVDDELQVTLTGYTLDDVRAWIPQFTSAGYEMTSTSGSLDDGSTDYTYKASRVLMNVTTTKPKSGGGTTVKEHYYKTNIELHYYINEYDNNYNPKVFGVLFKINFPNPLVFDPGGTLVAEDNGLFLYYKDAGISEKTKIVNKNGQIENGTIINDSTTLQFAWPNP